MTWHFYHQFWPTIGEAIVQEVKEFFDTRIMPPQLNQTHICLIPKIDKPVRMSDYRQLASVMLRIR